MEDQLYVKYTGSHIATYGVYVVLKIVIDIWSAWSVLIELYIY